MHACAVITSSLDGFAPWTHEWQAEGTLDSAQTLHCSGVSAAGHAAAAAAASGSARAASASAARAAHPRAAGEVPGRGIGAGAGLVAALVAKVGPGLSLCGGGRVRGPGLVASVLVSCLPTGLFKRDHLSVKRAKARALRPARRRVGAWTAGAIGRPRRFPAVQAAGVQANKLTGSPLEGQCG